MPPNPACPVTDQGVSARSTTETESRVGLRQESHFRFNRSLIQGEDEPPGLEYDIPDPVQRHITGEDEHPGLEYNIPDLVQRHITLTEGSSDG